MDHLKLSLSAVTAGIIAGGGALMAIVADGTGLNQTQWIIVIATALVSAAKDVRTYQAYPPRKDEML